MPLLGILSLGIPSLGILSLGIPVKYERITHYILYII